MGTLYHSELIQMKEGVQNWHLCINQIHKLSEYNFFWLGWNLSKGELPYLTLPRQFMQLHDPSYTVPVHLMLYDFSADFPQILQLLHINPENLYFCALTNIFNTVINSENFRAHRSIVEDTDLNSGPLFS